MMMHHISHFCTRLSHIIRDIAEKLEKQGSLISGERPDPVSVPHAVTSLSSLRIAEMSEAELRVVLPKLVAKLQEGAVTKRPDWWPHSTIPWTLHNLHRAVKVANPTSLRNLVNKCYSHLTKHCSKVTAAQPRVPTQPRVLDWLNSNPPSRSCSQPLKNCGMSSTNKMLHDGIPCPAFHLCCLCNREFSSRDVLQKHQVQCRGGTIALSVPSSPPPSDAPSPAAPTIASDDTTSSGCTSSNPVASSSSSSSTSCPVSYRTFVTALDLVPVHRARKIRQARRRNTECETIDLEEPKTPISPATPRTPKLLISLLSRDCSGSSGGSGSQGASSRRRLSYLRQSSRQEDKSKEDHSESGEESSDSGTDDSDEPKLHKKSLFSIDVTSGLGQRVLRHMTLEGHVPVILDSEQFCRTPIKDKYQDRLRTRQLSYPVTFKLTGKRMRQQSHYHQYNFTRAHKLEFMEKMRTGLNWRCRKLLGCIKKSSVVVKRLSVKTLHKWKPSLNKVSVPLKRLTEEEVYLWTHQPSARDRSVFSRSPLIALCKNFYQKSSVKHKDSKTASEPQLCQRSSGLPRAYRANTGQAPNNYHHQRKNVEGIHTSGNGLPVSPVSWDNDASFKSPAGRDPWMLADVKTPLKIDIPPMSGILSSARSTRSSPLDDSFSVMTVSSSDEENSRSVACCALCAVRNRSLCSPQRLPFGAVRRCSHSPASTSSLGSLPPELASPTVRPTLSVFPQPPGTSSCLSPISNNVRPCSHSPACSLKLSRCKSHKESPLDHRRLSTCFPESPLAQCDNSKSSLARTTGTLPASIPNKRERLGLTTRNGVVLPLPQDPADPKIDAHRPKTRSNLRASRQTFKTHSTVNSVREGRESQEKRGHDKQDFSNSNKVVENQRKNGRLGVENSVSPDRTSHKISHDTDGTEWTCCKGSADPKEQTDVDRFVDKARPRKRSLSGNLNHISSECAHNCHTMQLNLDGLRRTDVNGIDFENVSVGHARDTKSDTEAISSDGDVGSGPFLDTNPFLVSKARTPLFSSSILQQARRHWTSPQKSSSRAGGALRSGTTFRVGNVSPHPFKGRSAPERSMKEDMDLPLDSDQCSDFPHKFDHSDELQCSGRTEPVIRARKLLSAMQMMSVLESAKSKSPHGKSRPSNKSQRKRKRLRSKSDSGISGVSRGSDHHIHGQESSCSSTRKKMRLDDRISSWSKIKRNQQVHVHSIS